MRKILIGLFLLASCGIAGAMENERTVENAVTIDTLGAPYATIKVPTTSTVYTKSISLKNASVNGNVGVMYKATSSGTVTLALQALRSYDRPTTEGSSDVKYVVWNAPQSISDTSWHMATLDTIVSPYLVFKVIGSGSNDTSTSIQIKVLKQ